MLCFSNFKPILNVNISYFKVMLLMSFYTDFNVKRNTLYPTMNYHVIIGQNKMELMIHVISARNSAILGGAGRRWGYKYI